MTPFRTTGRTSRLVVELAKRVKILEDRRREEVAEEKPVETFGRKIK